MKHKHEIGSMESININFDARCDLYDGEPDFDSLQVDFGGGWMDACDVYGLDDFEIQELCREIADDYQDRKDEGY